MISLFYSSCLQFSVSFNITTNYFLHSIFFKSSKSNGCQWSSHTAIQWQDKRSTVVQAGSSRRACSCSNSCLRKHGVLTTQRGLHTNVEVFYSGYYYDNRCCMCIIIMEKSFVSWLYIFIQPKNIYLKNNIEVFFINCFIWMVFNVVN